MTRLTNAHPRAILFDLDDTLIDDRSGAPEAWREVCELAAEQIDGLHADAFLAAIDRQRKWYWSDASRHRRGRLDLRAASQQIVAQALLTLGCDLPDVAWALANTYRDLREQGLSLFDGAVETLEQARSDGIALALLTNGDGVAQRDKIERFDLARHFDYILIEGEFGCGKPDRRVYAACVEALRAQPETTWIVGDNLEWEVAAPQKLGLHTVWVDSARTGLPAGCTVQPNRIIQSISELFGD